MTLKGVDSRIAVDDPDVFEGHAHLIGGDLRQRRLVALPVRSLSGEDGEPAIGFEPNLRQLAAEHPAAHAHFGGSGCGFDEGRHSQTEIPALRSGSALLFAESRQIDAIERSIQRLAGGDAVHAQTRDEPVAFRAVHQVAAANLRRLDAQLVGDDVQQPFTSPGLHGPRAAVGDVGALVGRDDSGLT